MMKDEASLAFSIYCTLWLKPSNNICRYHRQLINTLVKKEIARMERFLPTETNPLDVAVQTDLFLLRYNWATQFASRHAIQNMFKAAR